MMYQAFPSIVPLSNSTSLPYPKPSQHPLRDWLPLVLSGPSPTLFDSSPSSSHAPRHDMLTVDDIVVVCRVTQAIESLALSNCILRTLPALAFALFRDLR
jgi:hypothetical protein